MELVIALIIGMLFGAGVTRLIFWSKPVGNLMVVGQRAGRYLFLELSTGLDEVCRKNSVSMNVVVKEVDIA